MTRTARSVLPWLVDRIFPLPQSLTPAERKADDERRRAQKNECETRIASLACHEKSLTGYLTAFAGTLERERHRQQSIEVRLTTVVGLSSIAGSIVFGAMLTNNLHNAPILLHRLILSCLLYLILQIASAMLAGVRGLERQPYTEMTFEAILPSPDEDRSHHLQRQIRECFDILIQNQDRNNAKVTQMAIAHCALKNFTVGLLILAILASVLQLQSVN